MLLGDELLVRIADPRRIVADVTTYRTSRVRLDLTELESAEQREWEARLNRSLGACGCGEGTAGLMIGALIVGISVATGVSWMQNGWPMAVALGVGICVVGATAGKMTGIVAGRLTARHLAEELAVIVQQRQAVTK